MNGGRLHNFDLQLCRYVLGTIAAHLDRPQFAAYVRKNLEPAVLDHIKALDDDDDPPPLLLTDQDFLDLIAVVWDVPSESSIPWIASPPLHRRAIECIGEIREGLAPKCAEQWMKASARFAKQLESDKTALKDGVEIVHEWAREVRRLLKAMGAKGLLPRPEGTAPTPSCPEPPAPASSGSEAVASPPGPQNEGALIAAITETQSLQREIRDLLVSQKTIKDFYTPSEVATMLGKAEFTVREWCRLGRIKAQKQGSGRGKHQAWVIAHDELQRLQREGLLPATRSG